MPAAAKTVARPDLTEQINSIFNDGVLIDLQIGFWTALKRNTHKDLGLTEANVPGFIVGVGTKRIIPKTYTDAWTKTAAHARYVVKRDAFQFPVADASFVPYKALPKIEKELTTLRTQFMIGKNDVLRHYDKIRREMLAAYPKHRAALEKEYPPRDVVESKFYFTWSAFTVTLPKRVKREQFDKKKAAAEEQAMARAEKELAKRMEHFVRSAVTTLREKTTDVCAEIAEKVRKGEVVTDRALNDLRRHIERFKTLNFFHDAVTEERLETLRTGVLEGRDADAFAEDEVMRAALAKACTEIGKQASNVTDIGNVVTGYRRKITL